MLNLTIYTILSLLLSTIVVIHAYTLYDKEFLIMVHLTNSKIHKTILINAFFCFVIFSVNLMTKFFFTEVREMEKIVNIIFIIIYYNIQILSFAQFITIYYIQISLIFFIYIACNRTSKKEDH